MEVTAGGDRLGDENAGRVEGLPDASQVDATGDLLDEHWGEPFRAKLLVHAQKVDLDRFDRPGGERIEVLEKENEMKKEMKKEMDYK